jgi:N-acetylglucosamine-6-sulfatase
MSDNGWMLGEHGLSSKVLAYEPSARVPLLIVAPGVTPNSKCDRLVSNLDLAPTLLEYAGLALPEKLQGCSLRPLLSDPKSEFREGFVYEGTGGYGDVPPMAAWISEKAKIIHTLGDKMGEASSFIECYDLQNDADETHNLSFSSELIRSREQAVAAFKQHDWKQTPRKKRPKK